MVKNEAGKLPRIGKDSANNKSGMESFTLRNGPDGRETRRTRP